MPKQNKANTKFSHWKFALLALIACISAVVFLFKPFPPQESVTATFRSEDRASSNAELEKYLKEEKIRVYYPHLIKAIPENEKEDLLRSGKIYAEYANLFPSDCVRSSVQELDQELVSSVLTLRNQFQRYLVANAGEVTRVVEDQLPHLIYHSNAIEGNTISLLDTFQLIQKAKTPSKSHDMREVYETLNHYTALTYANAHQAPLNITKAFIQRVHAKLMDRVIEDPGMFREHNVQIGLMKLMLPEYIEVPGLMSMFDHWIEKCLQERHYRKQRIGLKELMQDSSVSDDLIWFLQFAAEVHHKFVTVHPFVDGNGRMARILLNVLMSPHYPPVIVFVQDKSEYFAALHAAQRVQNHVPFYNFVLKSVKKSLEHHLGALHDVVEDFS